MDLQDEQEQVIERFITVTNSSKNLAEQYLARNNGDLMDAIENYFADTKDEAGPSSSAGGSSRGGGVKTFRDLNKGDDEEEDKKTDTNFFTGGEKSGLQVEDPNKKDDQNDRSLIDDIFQKAREQMGQPDDRMSAQQPGSGAGVNKFSGTGFKLGDGENPSQQIPDPSASMRKPLERANREITFWRQGFTVGDGPLNRYDDPANEMVLQQLNQGRVPLSLLDVEYGQDVDVSVIRKTDEDYTPPKKKVGGFRGSGHRLGSPVPGEPIGSNTSTTASTTESTPAPAPSSDTNTPKDPEPQGDTPVQIRFANGKRLSHKFNATDSIALVYEFVRSHEYSDPSRLFVLSHAFPVKPIEESDAITVADAKLKNAVIVQRWA